MKKVAAVGIMTVAIGMAENTESGLGIDVRVYNFASVPARTLKASQAKASAIYRELGVRTRWLECPLNVEKLTDCGECEGASGPTALVLKLVSNQRAGQFYSSRNSLGFALLSEHGRPTTDAWVFTGRVAEQAREADADQSTLLGYAMAHEIGHLLLGANSHTATGIMTGHWDKRTILKAESGILRFSSDQQKRILKDIRERVAIARNRTQPVNFNRWPIALVERECTPFSRSTPF